MIVRVTPTDRDAYLSLNNVGAIYRAQIVAGEWDTVTGMQAFARHRIESTRELLEAAEGVAEWVNMRPDTHPYDAFKRLEAAIAKAKGEAK